MNSTKVLATFSKNSILNTSFINQLLNNEYNTITRTRSYFLLIFLFYFMSIFEFCRLICFDYFIVNLIIYLWFIICMHFFSVFSFSSYILFFFFFFLLFFLCECSSRRVIILRSIKYHSYYEYINNKLSFENEFLIKKNALFSSSFLKKQSCNDKTLSKAGHTNIAETKQSLEALCYGNKISMRIVRSACR